MMERRSVLKNLAAASVALPAAKLFAGDMKKSSENNPLKLKGNINHSVCRWILGDLSLDELCNVVKNIGFNAIDLLKPDEWPIVQKHGVYCSMCYTSSDFQTIYTKVLRMQISMNNW